MKKFSEILLESTNSFALTAEEFNEYKKAIEETKRSKEFLKLMWMVGQYPELFEQQKLEDILRGRLTSKTVPADVARDIFKIAKKIGDEVKLLPQLLTAAQRESILKKEIDPDDFTIDLETDKGRNELASRYMPLINKMVNQFYNSGDCVLSKEELLSAALFGFADAMNTFKNPDELKEYKKETGDKTVSFTSYASYKIKFRILRDMSDYGRTVHMSKYEKKKWKEEHGEDAELPSEFSIDNFHAHNGEGEPINFDEFFGLAGKSNGIDAYMNAKDRKEMFSKIFQRLEQKFSSRDCTILYKVLGMNGYKREKTKDIAKEFNISSAAVSQVVDRIIKFVASDKYCKSLGKAYEALEEEYVVGKLLEIYNADHKTIVESLLYDDIYILLENLGKWKNKDKFQKMVNKATDPLAVDDALTIYNILQHKTILDEKETKKINGALVQFLEGLYPDRSFKKATPKELIAELDELASIAAEFGIKW